jgi:hypothetical protein
MNSCGTYSGYIIHGKNKEKPCDDCRLAANKYRREKRQADVDKLGYDPRRFKRHNITKDTYNNLLNKYDGKCWICKISNASHIDHNHLCCSGNRSSCGKCIRGILCSNCNTAIGLLKDSELLLDEAKKYLKMER